MTTRMARPGRRLCVVVCLGLALAILAPVAHADGDPASDVLLTQRVYFPYDTPLSTTDRMLLQATVDEANRRGYPIKVALIGAPVDLGAIPELLGKPQQYAQFLGLELSFVYHRRLLVAMPDGFGIYDNRKPVRREENVLRVVPIGGKTALASAAATAVRKLAAADGIQLPTPVVKRPANHDNRDRLVIVVAALVAVGLLALVTGWRRRRQPVL